MADEFRRRASERRPVGLQVRLAFGDTREFVERYATNISEGGIFIRSRERRPVGERLAFELRLRSDEIVFSGEGIVRWVQGLDARGLGTQGMGLQFDKLTDESRSVLARILEQRAGGHAPPPVEGADPTSWRPLEEFPPLPVEPEPEQSEPVPPPVMAPVRAPAREFAAADPPPRPEGARRPAAAPPVAPPVIAPEPAPAPEAPGARGRVPTRFPTPPVMMPVRAAPAGDVVAGPPVLAPVRPADPPASPPVLTPVIAAPAPAAVVRAAPHVAYPGAIGVDLGWSTVRIAATEGSTSRALELSKAGALPAAVAEVKGALVAGEDALEAILDGAPGARGLVPILGSFADATSLAAWRRRNLVELVAGDDGRASVRLGKRAYPARALLEALLAGAKARAEDHLGGTIARAAVCLPSYVGDAARRELRAAAAACGLVVERFVPAAAAAVLATFGATGKRRVLTIDFAEGALEAAVVEQAGPVLEVVASGADPDLGTSDLDLALVESILQQFEKETGFQCPEDLRLFELVRDAAAGARRALSDALDTDVYVPDLAPAGLSSIELEQRVTRARFQALTTTHVDRAFELVRAVLAARGYGGADLDAILLTGDGRVMPLVRRLSEKLAHEPLFPPQAESAAARGAALVALGGAGGPLVLQGLVGASLGVGLPGGQYRRVVDRQLALPVERSYTAPTTSDNQRTLELHLFQGDKPGAFDNDYVGLATVGPLPPGWRGDLRVALLLAVDAEGELSVHARDASSGRELPVSLDRTRRLEDARKALLP